MLSWSLDQKRISPDSYVEAHLKLAFDFCRSSPPGRDVYVTTSLLTIKPESKIARSKPEALRK